MAKAEKKNVVVRFPLELHARLKETAVLLGQSLNCVVLDACQSSYGDSSTEVDHPIPSNPPRGRRGGIPGGRDQPNPCSHPKVKQRVTGIGVICDVCHTLIR